MTELYCDICDMMLIIKEDGTSLTCSNGECYNHE